MKIKKIKRIIKRKLSDIIYRILNPTPDPHRFPYKFEKHLVKSVSRTIKMCAGDIERAKQKGASL
jgi:hypothetical protein